MTCKDCIQYDFCAGCGFAAEDETASRCKYFKNKDLYIEIPCMVGAKLYDISELLMPKCYSPEMYIFNADDICVSKDARGYIFTIDGNDYRYGDFGNSVFFSKEEAIAKVEEEFAKLKGGLE